MFYYELSLMDIEKLRRATDHLNKTFEIFYIWDVVASDIKINQKFYENKVLGAMNYQLYQMVNIKLAIFFEDAKSGKHSIDKIINCMPNSLIKQKIFDNWQLFKTDKAELIKRIKYLRAKYFAHYDNIGLDEVVVNLTFNPEILETLKEIQITLIAIWVETVGKAPLPYDEKEITDLAFKTFQ